MKSILAVDTMKGALLVLALLVTRELGIKMGETRKEGTDGLLDPCLTPSQSTPAW